MSQNADSRDVRTQDVRVRIGAPFYRDVPWLLGLTLACTDSAAGLVHELLIDDQRRVERHTSL